MQRFKPKSAVVKLDEYACDLNLTLSNGGYTVTPMTKKGFVNMWGGVKGDHGVRYWEFILLYVSL